MYCPTSERQIRLLERSDVFGLIALSAGHYVELDGLTLFEVLESVAGNTGVVNENICAAFAGDEAVALFGVEKFDGALCHFILLSITTDSPP